MIQSGHRFLKIKGYFSLMKLRVIELLLVATVPTMIFAQSGIPPFSLIINTLFGGTLAAGSANAFNMYIERDIDKVMERTKNRPLVTGVLKPKEALIFAWITGISSAIFLWIAVNPLSSILAICANIFYVFVYTMLLKRRTVQNIVWGGVAGCFPVLIGWAAVTNTLSYPALILFMIIFFWTPPHYWPLSLNYKDDYRKANIPMLGSVSSAFTVSKHIILYSWIMFGFTILLIPVGNTKVFYAIIAVMLGIWFLYKVHDLKNRIIAKKAVNPMNLFRYSIIYLALLFLSIAIDSLL